MSLEEALNRNTTALETHNGLIEKLLAKAGSAPATTAGTTDAGGDKPGKRGGKKDEVKLLTLDDVKPGLAAWLNEFPKVGDVDHVETGARKVALKNFFTSIGVAKLPDITKAEDFAKLNTWIGEQKAKGRLAPDEEAGDEDDMGLD